MQRTHRNTTRSAALVVTAFILAASAATFTHARDLSFEERVKAQQAIEQVYWNHRIWPEQNSREKPALDQVLPASVIEANVRAYLRLSDALCEAGRPVTHQLLLDEMDRMARDSKAPGVLQELFAALGDDTDLIAETLVRQKLVARFGAAPPADEGGGASIPKGASGEAASETNRTQAMTSVGCEVEAWSPTSTGPGAPTGRSFHTAVWTGSEMIVWGGSETGASDFPTDTGARYDPATDTWTPTTTDGAPAARGEHTAVWTGSEMIEWGGNVGSAGGGFVLTGGRYNPVTDTWAPTSTVGAPLPRGTHTAIWSGSRMVVWGGVARDTGGQYSDTNTGGRYDPSLDAWTPTSTASAPTARDTHTAVWTGTEMIVWGGWAGPPLFTNTGGRYNPVTDSWLPTDTSTAPPGVSGNTVVWTGASMIIWGGLAQDHSPPSSGRVYDPITDRWTAMSTMNAPVGRTGHTAVWTGSQMIVWGGVDSYYSSTGGRYIPAVDSWIPTTTDGAPERRTSHTAVWTGTDMVIWGGVGSQGTIDSGGRYCPGCDDGDPCTVDTYSPSAGCTHTPSPGAVCDDGDTCTAYDACSDALVCVGQPLAPGVPCDDGNPCTENETCDAAGLCGGGGPVSCDDANGCTVDTCNVASGCVHTPLNCGDGNSCTDDSCDPAVAGLCVHVNITSSCCDNGGPRPAGEPCADEGNRCTIDTCSATGECVHTQRSCDDGDPCTFDTCLNLSGACAHGPRSCDDGIGCTMDACLSSTGECSHFPDATRCDDHDAGTMDLCNPAAGSCEHIPCDSVCNDNNACTIDLCGPAFCYHTPTTGPCDDGNPCTTNDACGGSTCVGGPPLNCDDGNPCTVDACDPVSGCSSTATDPSCKEPKSVSFYRHVCRKEHQGEVMTDANVDCVNDALTFAPVDTIDAMCGRLDPDPGGDNCEKAEAEFMATLLNRCKGRITDDEPIHSKCSAHTVVGQSIDESDVLLSNPSRTAQECMLADCESTEINSGKAIGPVLTLTMQPDGGVRLDWTPLPASDRSLAPTSFAVWRGPLRGPFTKVAVVTALSYVDPTSEPAVDRHYEVTAE